MPPPSTDAAPLPVTVTPKRVEAVPGRSLLGGAFLYFLPWALVLLLTLGYYYRTHALDDMATVQESSTTLVANAAGTLTRVLHRTSTDVLYLGSDRRLSRFVASSASNQAGAQTLAAELAESWIRFLEIKRTYDQIRFIDNDGQERVRVNYSDGQSARVSSDRLQRAADFPELAAAYRMGKGEVFVSPLDLTGQKDHGKTSSVSSIRFGLPIFDESGRRLGVLVMHFQISDLLGRLDAVSEAAKAPFMLVNAQGHWLHLGGTGENGEKGASISDRNATLESRYPGTWELLMARDSDRVVNAHGLWSWTTIYPYSESDAGGAQGVSHARPRTGATDPEANFWKLLVHVPRERMAEIQNRRLVEFSGALLVGFLMLALAAWRLSSARQKQSQAEIDLRRLNQTLETQVGERTKRLQNEVLDRQMAERRYRESSEQYQHMVAATVDGYWLLDDRGGFLDANKAACDMLGLSRDALLSMTLADLAVSGGRENIEQRIADLMLTGSQRFESRLRRLDGSMMDVEIAASYLPDYLRFIAFVRDISERKQNEQERRLAAMVMRNADEAILVVSAEGHVLSANPAFTKITGIPEKEYLGVSVDHLGLGSTDGKVPFSRLLAGQSGWRAELRGRRKTGEVYPVWLSATAVRDANNAITHYVCVFSDITEIKESQARLDFLAHHDALTSLPNRLLFRARLEHSIERAGRSKARIAVMFIDLDHFKEVNDTMGHAVGDQLLIDLAAAMSGCLRAEDTLARLGGDEFVVLLEQVEGSDSVATVLEKFRKVYPWAMLTNEGQRIEVTASIGIALYPDNATDADGLVMVADAAMYRAKEGGRDRAVYA